MPSYQVVGQHICENPLPLYWGGKTTDRAVAKERLLRAEAYAKTRLGLGGRADEVAHSTVCEEGGRMSMSRTKERFRELAKELLCIKMSAISDGCWCAGWLVHLEYDLWAIIKGDHKRKYGMGLISDEEVRELHQLATDAGGWWIHREHEPVFVTLDEWQVLYESHKEGE